MGVFSEEMRTEIGRGAAAARDLESWLASEARDLDGDLSPEAAVEEDARHQAIVAIAASVLAMAPQMSGFDIAAAVDSMAAGGCRNALGHMLFAHYLRGGVKA